MSVYIKGMEMPKSCHFCEMYEADLYWCRAAKRNIEGLNDYDNRSSFCPLVPVPDHSRLIDADKIYNAVEQRYRISSGIEHRCEMDLLDLICKSPTIIPANKEETE